MPLLDAHQRPLANLRLSVTDRCNLRCQYCMPEEDYVWLPREDILQFEEIDRLVDQFLHLGVQKVRLTGGEPLLRRDLPALLERLSRKPAIADLAMTTNAVLLAPAVGDLKKAGLHRLTISLDTLQRDRFIKLARFDELARVQAGIDAAVDVFPGFKIDSVIIRGVNDDEMIPLLEFAKSRGAELRFIEYMDVGGATAWSMSKVVARQEMLATIGAHYGGVEPLQEHSSAPADRYRLPDGSIFGIIASTTEPFCRTCDRSRLTADGVWYLCLYASRGIDLRGPLRGGVSDEALRDLITSVWHARTDRGAEQRVSLRERSPLIPLQALKRDPHLEMHTRGG
ncbi:MAG TPA: GTP 3',8-cyclase MoaA [Vicinamibacterales bacterium]|nr:GTP 3',8-cyclase MoaA [Vicinamibacterales bacterium]